MLLRLPTEMLVKIASHAVVPGLVVAAGTNVDARTALRKGTDVAERSRFGGIGVTVREAEQILRTRYACVLDEDWLVSRAAAGRALCRENLMRWVENPVEQGEYHPDAPECEDDFRWEFSDETVVVAGEQNIYIASGWLKMMIAYGADLDAAVQRDGGETPLHLLDAYAPPDAVDVARLLLAAGSDIDARTRPYYDVRGPTPLCWCITAQPCQLGGPEDAHYELATFLIEQGCDVLGAHRGYHNAVRGNRQDEEFPNPLTLLGYLSTTMTCPQTPENQSFVAYFREKLVDLGVGVDSDSDSETESAVAEYRSEIRSDYVAAVQAAHPCHTVSAHEAEAAVDALLARTMRDNGYI